MPIEFNCPTCFKGYRVADDSAGKRTKCKDCGNSMTVPDTSGLSFADEDTGLHRRPAKRHSSTKILPADRPARKTAGPPPAPGKRNIPSDTVKLDSRSTAARQASAKPQSAATAKKPAPGPRPEPPVSKLPPAKLPAGLKAPGDLPKLKSVAGKTRVMPEAPKKRMVNFVLMLGAAAMIVGFFLPWFTPALAGWEPVAGFMLPLRVDELAADLHKDGVYTDNVIVTAVLTNTTAVFAFFALYMLPILALYAVIDDIRSAGKGKSHWWIRLLAALSPLLAAAAVYFAFQAPITELINTGGVDLDHDETLAAIGPGTYTLLGGWLFLLLAIVIAPKVRKPAVEPMPPKPAPEEDDVPDVSAQAAPRLPQPRGK
jgi:hypothetical protein